MAAEQTTAPHAADEGPARAPDEGPPRTEVEMIKAEVSRCIADMRRSVLGVSLPGGSAAPPETRLAGLLESFDSVADALACVDDGIAPPREWLEQRAYGVTAAMCERCYGCGRVVTTREAREIERRAAERNPASPVAYLAAASDSAARAAAAMDSAAAEANGPRVLAAAQAMAAAVSELAMAFATAINAPGTAAPTWIGDASGAVDQAQREPCPVCTPPTHHLNTIENS